MKANKNGDNQRPSPLNKTMKQTRTGPLKDM